MAETTKWLGSPSSLSSVIQEYCPYKLKCSKCLLVKNFSECRVIMADALKMAG